MKDYWGYQRYSIKLPKGTDQKMIFNIYLNLLTFLKIQQKLITFNQTHLTYLFIDK